MAAGGCWRGCGGRARAARGWLAGWAAACWRARRCLALLSGGQWCWRVQWCCVAGGGTGVVTRTTGRWLPPPLPTVRHSAHQRAPPGGVAVRSSRSRAGGGGRARKQPQPRPAKQQHCCAPAPSAWRTGCWQEGRPEGERAATRAARSGEMIDEDHINAFKYS